MTKTPSDSDYPIVPLPVLRRLPFYYTYLLEQRQNDETSISSSQMARDLNLHPVQVRKDLAMTNVSGRPRTGFNIQALLDRLEEMLGYNDVKPALIIGVGHLGSALINYTGFEGFGLKFVAAFDNDPDVIGETVGQLTVQPLDDLEKTVANEDIHIGVIAVPGPVSQDVCDRLVASGEIKAIWNFAPNHLQVPEGIILQNENIAASLSVLSKRLMDQEYLEAHGEGIPDKPRRTRF